MRRLVLLIAFAVGLALTTPATTALAAGHGNDTFKIKGTVFTTDAHPESQSLERLIITSTAHPSTVAGLGRVSLFQPQAVTPTSADFMGQVPYTGFIASSTLNDVGPYFTAADGSKLFFTFRSSFQAFDPGIPDFPPGAPWPIAFPAPGTNDFVITFTGGTGRFAHANGTATGYGSYCFVLNQGFYVFDGTVTLPHRG